MYNLETEVISGEENEPPAIIVIGEPDMGKTTFGASSNSPIIFDIENGAKYINCQKVKPKSYKDVLGWINSLLTGKHEYKTIVIDTLDALESLIHAEIVKETGAKHISDKYNDGTAYAAGYISALNRFRIFLQKLDELRNQRGMAIILLAHAMTKSINDPVDGSYDKRVIKVDHRISAQALEWADAALYVTKKTVQSPAGGIVQTEERVAKCKSNLSATCKNRLHLPAEIPFTWNSFINSIGTNVYKPEVN